LDGSSGVRTTLSTSRTTRTPRRAPIATALAAFCLAVPVSGLIGGTALAASDGPSAHASDRALTAADKPAGFIGPVAPAVKWKGATPQATPYTNAGGVTVGANTTSYETVADGKGSTFTGVGGGQPSGDIASPQPLSNADQNNTGANDTSSTNPYASTRDGAPSLNGNGGGEQVGQPCAGCVGKADNKNPPGQAPNATDGNAGYECDRNHGIGRSNPAHTGCVPAPAAPVYCPGTTTPMPASGICASGGGTVFCPGTTTPMPSNGICGSSSSGGGQLCPNGSAMPASGNVADCTSPVVCPAGTVMTAGSCTTPAQGGLAEPAAAPPVVSNGTSQPVLSPLTGGTTAPGTTAPGDVTPVTDDTTGEQGEPATALPFTGSNDAQLAAIGLLMLLLGGGLLVATRPRYRGAPAA
jgi:hypothetical protein